MAELMQMQVENVARYLIAMAEREAAVRRYGADGGRHQGSVEGSVMARAGGRHRAPGLNWYAQDDGREVAAHVSRLVEDLTPRGVKVRRTSLEMVGSVTRAGTWLRLSSGWCRAVHGAVTGAACTIQTIRGALRAEILVKWTAPVRSVSTLLLCLSLGVDRFNCDVDQLLGDASRAEWLAPFTILLEGFDY